jgi:hypothetical protein
VKFVSGFIMLAGLIGFAASLSSDPADASPTVSTVFYSGACDASAAVAVDETHFLAASDEDSVLRLYRRDQPGPPLKTYSLGPALELGRRARETDIEGAARIGDVAYWISSHARDPDGQERPDRCRFLATRLYGTGTGLTVELVGRPCKTLIAELAVAPQLAKYDLAEATARSAKEKGGLNVEGLCADRRGGLLIGFRNPIPQKRGLIVPLRNPEQVIDGDRPMFGEPIELDLGKLGVRDLAFHGDRFLIVAGPRKGADRFALFDWMGPGSAARALGIEFHDGFSPEGVVFYPDTGWRAVQLFSDDSGNLIGGRECKDVPEAAQRRFGARWVELPAR